MMNPEQLILNTIFNNLTTGVQPIDKLNIARQFNKCSGSGIHAMITQKIYDKNNQSAPDLVKMTYQTFRYSNQNGTSYNNQLEKIGAERSSQPIFNQAIPYTVEKLEALDIKDAKFGRFYYNPYTKVEDKELRKTVLNDVCSTLNCKQKDIPNKTTHVYNNIEYTINGSDSFKNIYIKTDFNNIDQVKVQYWLMEEGDNGYKKESIYFLGGKLTKKEDINFNDYIVNNYGSSGKITNYRNQFIGNFLQIIPGISNLK